MTIAGEQLAGAAPGDWSGVIWQLGRTSIATPAPFSDLTGFERLQTVVGGKGLLLDTPDGAIDLSEPYTVVRYDGGTPIVSRLTDGTVEVVNLIARRDMVRISMAMVRSGESYALPPGTHVIHACAGQATVVLTGSAYDLQGDAALMTVGAGGLAVSAGIALVASVEKL